MGILQNRMAWRVLYQQRHLANKKCQNRRERLLAGKKASDGSKKLSLCYLSYHLKTRSKNGKSGGMATGYLFNQLKINKKYKMARCWHIGSQQQTLLLTTAKAVIQT